MPTTELHYINEIARIRELVRLYNNSVPEQVKAVFNDIKGLSLFDVEIQLYIELARYYSTVQANYNRAFEEIENAVSLLPNTQNILLNAKVIRIKGTILYYRNQLADAQGAFRQAIATLEQLPITDEVLIETGENYLQLALLHKVTEFRNVRKQMAQTALDFFTRAKYEQGLGRCYTIFASIFFTEENYTQALETHQKALLIHERTQNKQGIAVALNNIGSCYRELGDNERAIDFLQRSLVLKLELGNPNNIANSHVHLAEYYSHLNDLERAIEEFTKALQIFEKIGNKVELSFVYNSISEVLEKKGEYSSALSNLRKYNEIQRELFSFEKNNAIAEALAKYEIDKRDKEAELLRQKSAEIEEYAHKLEVSNRELEQYAHVASHDLKEPLRMIGSYIGLLHKRLEGRLNEEEIQFMSFVLDGTRRMDTLISDLLEYSKLNKAPKLQSVNLFDVVQLVKQNVTATNNQVSCNGNFTVTADHTLILQLFQNLISNGLKYNTSQCPTVDVRMELSDTQLLINFTDNGIGVPAQHRDRIFEIFKRLHSKEQYSGSGIGLAISKKIVEYFKGKLTVADNPEGGSIFTVSLPASMVIK